MHNWRKRKTRRYKIVNKDTKKIIDDFMEAGDIEAKARFRRLLKKLPNRTEVLLYAFRKNSPKKRGEWELLLQRGKDAINGKTRKVRVERICQQDFGYLKEFRETTTITGSDF